MQRVARTEIELEVGERTILFRLPAKDIAELQERRGYKVSWPDGSTGRRPKAWGTIVREHMFGEHDLDDTREIIRMSAIAGGMDRADATLFMDEVVARLPTQDQWKLGVQIVTTVAQGFMPPGDEDTPPGNGEARPEETTSSTSPKPPET